MILRTAMFVAAAGLFAWDGQWLAGGLTVAGLLGIALQKWAPSWSNLAVAAVAIAAGFTADAQIGQTASLAATGLAAVAAIPFGAGLRLRMPAAIPMAIAATVAAIVVALPALQTLDRPLAALEPTTAPGILVTGWLAVAAVGALALSWQIGRFLAALRHTQHRMDWDDKGRLADLFPRRRRESRPGGMSPKWDGTEQRDD